MHTHDATRDPAATMSRGFVMTVEDDDDVPELEREDVDEEVQTKPSKGPQRADKKAPKGKNQEEPSDVNPSFSFDESGGATEHAWDFTYAKKAFAGTSSHVTSIDDKIGKYRDVRLAPMVT